MRAAAPTLAVLLAVTACTSGTSSPAPTAPASSPTASLPPSLPPVSSTAADPTPADPSPPAGPSWPADPTTPSVAPSPRAFDSVAAMTTVRHLAGLGPREATGTAYVRALAWLEQRFRAAGYRVRRQSFRVPAGTSWGIPVRAGTSWNLVATRPGFDPAAPHRVVGAHLDTVPQAPGAEDNASGVAVLLETARLSDRRTPRLPTVFVAFGAEEPRGTGDELHHFGSRAYVASLGAAQRSALRGMVSLDRVGVGSVVPICAGSADDVALRNQVRAVAARLGVRSRACVNRSSDHWSFVRAGLDGVRLGSTPYAEYHSARDLPKVVNPAQLARMGRVVSGWLAG
jgi:Peptidase family M28